MMVLDRGKDCAMEQKQAIEQRISRRSFLQTPIEQQILRQLLEAIEEVNETSGLTVSYLEDGSDAFAGFKSYGMFDGVRAMLVLKGNRELAFLKEKVGYYGEQLILKATELGLGSCWIQGRLREAADGKSTEQYLRDLLGFPAHCRLEAILSLGVPQEQKEAYSIDSLLTEKIHREKY